MLSPLHTGRKQGDADKTRYGVLLGIWFIISLIEQFLFEHQLHSICLLSTDEFVLLMERDLFIP